MKIALAIPTYNAGDGFRKVCQLIKKQSANIDDLLVVDSSSNDQTAKIAMDYGFRVKTISKKDFSHGGTRKQIAFDYYEKEYDYLILMSHDVYLQDSALSELISYITGDSLLGVTFGKQEVDLKKGNLYEYYARKFNYPVRSYKRTIDDKITYGIKTIFNSDAFAIYNLKIMSEVNFFEDHEDVSEDMLIAHKIINAGYKVGYCSSARVYHTHNYSIEEEFRRYIKIGKFYKKHDLIVKEYGMTNSNGLHLLVGELVFLYKIGKFYLIPYSLLRNFAKYAGHKIGYYF